jgi:NADPH-dependent curcumin reductase CurA
LDETFNYAATDNLFDEIKKRCPDGIDVYFDNVGGTHLEAAIESMNNFGRIVLCGMISIYNATRPPRAPRNLISAISKRLTLQGFIVNDHKNRMIPFLHDMGQWLNQGNIHWKETIVQGIENAPRAFCRLFTGDSFGKMLVKL